MNINYQIALRRITADDKTRIAECLRNAYDRAKARLGFTDFSFTWGFSAKLGTKGGTAEYQNNKINLNPVLFTENREEFFAQVIPHELAHLVTHNHFGTKRTGKGWDHHGANWQYVMRVMGCRVERCHSMDVANAVIRKTRKFRFQCTCGVSGGLTTNRRNQVIRRTAILSCRTCKTTVTAAMISEIV